MLVCTKIVRGGAYSLVRYTTPQKMNRYYTYTKKFFILDPNYPTHKNPSNSARYPEITPESVK